MFMAWLRKAPTPVVVTAIVGFVLLALAVLAAFVVLSLNGNDTEDLRNWIQTIGITILLPLLGINTVASIAGANSASAAEDQTNGIHAQKDRQIAQLTADLRAARGDSTR
jgi:NADH:ubiquinone oxidoreductase subunit 6 (subunit J)